MTYETSLSLLERLRQSPESESWNRLAEVYTPLIRTWLKRYEVQDSDTDDLLQEVLMAVARDLGKFERRGQSGAFRGWLKAILLNRLRQFWRARDCRPQALGDSDIVSRLAQLDDPTSELSELWNQEHDQYVLRQLLAIVEPQFAATTWKAFCRVALDGAKPVIVADEIGISRNAVIISKCRVLNRLREEAAGLVESSSSFL